MINIKYCKEVFLNHIDKYEDKTTLGFDLKVKHTFRVMKISKELCNKLNLSIEEKKLAQVIALLHDIGRFEELLYMKKLDSSKYDHASVGVKILFEDKVIDKFNIDDKYYNTINKAVLNHSRKTITDDLNEEELLQTKIIRDADKIDNFKLKIRRKAEECFPGNIFSKEEVENSLISDKVYLAIMNRECVDVKDRKTSLDLFICVLGFVYDLNFKESLELVKENNYINRIIDKFKYTNKDTIKKMEDIRLVLNKYIEEKTTFYTTK